MNMPPSHISGDLSGMFAEKHDVRAIAVEQLHAEIKLDDGQLTPEQVSMQVNPARSHQAAETQRKQAEKRHHEHVVAMLILEDMRRRLDDLDAQMAERYERLRVTYGDDVVSGMADTYLLDGEAAGLETDEEKLAALARKFLDENGEIKAEYAHLEEAKYVRDWQEAERLRTVVAKYEGRSELTDEEAAEVQQAAQNSSLSDNMGQISSSTNHGYQSTIDNALDSNSAGNEVVVTTIPLKFN